MTGVAPIFVGVDDLPDRLPPTDPNDVRFQYEVIRQLAESVRQQTAALAHMQQQLGSIAERLTKIEANRLHADVERLEKELAEERARVDVLMRDKDRRDGERGTWKAIQASAPWAAIASAGAAVLAWLKA